MKKYNISVVITIFNKEEYLVKAIESIQNQTLKDIEIICVNDGSTDSSGVIIEQLAKNDNRIKVIHTENRGQVAATKLGINVASAKYIGFVDADDWVEENMYEILYYEMKNNKLDFISSGVIRENETYDYDRAEEGIYQSNKELKGLFKNFLYTESSFVQKVFGNMPSKLFVRDTLLESSQNINNSINFREDDCFTYSYMMRCKRIKILHRAFYHYTYNEQSVSNKADDMFFLRVNYFYMFLKKEFSMFEYGKEVLPQLDCYFARTLVLGIRYKAGLSLEGYVSVEYPFIFKKRVAVYGAGEYGKKFIHKLIADEQRELVCVFDRDWSNKKNEINLINLSVDSPDNVLKYEFDVIAIAILDKRIGAQVKKLLINLGVTDEKIVFV